MEVQGYANLETLALAYGRALFIAETMLTDEIKKNSNRTVSIINLLFWDRVCSRNYILFIRLAEPCLYQDHVIFSKVVVRIMFKFSYFIKKYCVVIWVVRFKFPLMVSLLFVFGLFYGFLLHLHGSLSFLTQFAATIFCSSITSHHSFCLSDI